jgi:hypothetical protein
MCGRERGLRTRRRERARNKSSYLQIPPPSQREKRRAASSLAPVPLLTDERARVLALVVDVEQVAGAQRVREGRVELAKVVEDLWLFVVLVVPR